MRRFLSLFACLLAYPSLAATIEQVTPSRDAQWLRVAISARDLLDARTRSTIESGLPGSCVYQIELLDARDQVVVRRILRLALHCDVWEQRYELEGPRGVQRFADLTLAESALAQPGAVELAKLRDLGSGLYRLRIEVDVRPIAAADRLRVAEFLSQSGGGKEELHIDIGVLFRRMSQQREGAAPAFVSAPFAIEQLELSP